MSTEGLTATYTIYNHEALIPKIIFGLKEGFDFKDEFIFIFDNCTDNSYEVFMNLKKYLPSKPKVIINQKDEYEIKCNNRALREFTRNTIILFQDDIINHDQHIKEKISKIVDKYGDKLGMLGGRAGFEFSGEKRFPEVTYHRVSNWEHLDKQYGYRLKEWEYKERTFLNRGPIVLTRDLIEKAGYLDEAYYPLWGDDMDYCARCRYTYNLKNVVFQCNVESQLRWGATHNGESKLNMKQVMRKNWHLFMSRWSDIIHRNYENTIKFIS
jgi:hypothetical protein